MVYKLEDSEKKKKKRVFPFKGAQMSDLAFLGTIPIKLKFNFVYLITI